MFHAAKCYESIIQVLKETQNWVEIAEFAHRASSLYQQSGSHEAAASALEKAAKIVEPHMPEGALQLYHHAVQTILVSNLHQLNGG